MRAQDLWQAPNPFNNHFGGIHRIKCKFGHDDKNIKLVELYVSIASVFLNIDYWIGNKCLNYNKNYQYMFDENFKISSSITGLILKVLSVLLSFLLSTKCRFWRISQKRFQIVVFWIPSLPIRLPARQNSVIVGNLLIAIKKFIPINAFSSSLVTVKFLPFWWA